MALGVVGWKGRFAVDIVAFAVVQLAVRATLSIGLAQAAIRRIDTISHDLQLVAGQAVFLQSLRMARGKAVGAGGLS
eukprot:1926159-Prymnesium_polylepis.1